ncbi:glycosyltransferase family 2 protein [Cellulomonas aerilata]|uniref:glycosyltransferase family 2 protein n=1 Tax=Cellulomonas aerilata TaxID=515326 RepID=UPI001649E0B8|nr:glycosyltransferase [Cellulomonas aerilata]
MAIITRTKQRPLLLERALDDILRQTFDDFVVVVVNDGGDPAPVDDLAARIAARADGRLRVLHLPESVGMEAASNRGLAATRSTFVVVHDDDDTWDPHFLERAVGHLTGVGSAGVMVRTSVVYERIVDGRIERLGEETLAAAQQDVTLFDTLRNGYGPPISFLYRREVHRQVGLYDESLPVLGDWDFTLRFLQRHAIDFIDGAPLAFWHHRRDSTGADGNTVIAQEHVHRRYERIVRDRYLRAGLRKPEDLGLVVYLAGLAKQQDQRIEALGDQVALLAAHLTHLTDLVRGDIAALHGRAPDVAEQEDDAPTASRDVGTARP